VETLGRGDGGVGVRRCRGAAEWGARARERERERAICWGRGERERVR
jgi:hypothetical protein